MRIRIFAALALLSLSLSACATGPDGKIIPPKPADVISTIRQIAVNACGFLPLAETVRDILASGQYTAPAAIAEAICTSVRSATAVRGQVSRPTVAGVAVKGRFVRR